MFISIPWSKQRFIDLCSNCPAFFNPEDGNQLCPCLLGFAPGTLMSIFEDDIGHLWKGFKTFMPISSSCIVTVSESFSVLLGRPYFNVGHNLFQNDVPSIARSLYDPTRCSGTDCARAGRQRGVHTQFRTLPVWKGLWFSPFPVRVLQAP